MSRKTMTINKNRLYILSAPLFEDSDDRQYVHMYWKDKPLLMVFQSIYDTKLFIDARISAMHTLYNAEHIKLSLQELYEETILCEYPGVAFVSGYTVRPCLIDELEELANR